MDLKDIKSYDCQVADFFANRKQMHLTEKDIAQILNLVENHSRKSGSLEHYSGCKEWIMTISPDNSFSLAEANALPKRNCQVVDFVGKKATIDKTNRKGKDNVKSNLLPLNSVKQNCETEMRNHFSVVDQKLRQCIQQKKNNSFWERTADAVTKVLKKL